MNAIRLKILFVKILGLCLALQGCAGQGGSLPNMPNIPGIPGMSPTSTAPSTGSSIDTATDASRVLAAFSGCAIGAVIGAGAAIALAKAEQRRLKLPPAEYRKRERGYIIGLSLAGGASGCFLANTLYGKLKESGKKEREQALVSAARDGRPTRYGEPTDPSLKGSVIPGKRYSETLANRECVDLEDTLADPSSKDAIFPKMCRSLPNGDWQQVTV